MSVVKQAIIYPISPPERERFPVRQGITVLPAADPNRIRLGWIIHEEVGIVVLNSYAVGSVTINSGGDYFPPCPIFLMCDLFSLNSAEEMKKVEVDENAMPIVGFGI